MLHSRKMLATGARDAMARSGSLHLLFAGAAGASVLVFWPELRSIVQFSLGSDVYSYIPLIPVISLLLILDRRRIIFDGARPEAIPTVVFIALATCMLFASRWLSSFTESTRTSWQSFGLVCWWSAVFGLCYGKGAVKKALFPLVMLLFMIPLPDRILQIAIALLQNGSAYCSEIILRVLGVPVLRTGMVLSVAGLDLEVGPQCSGIRSSIALLIIVIVSSHLFLKSGWHRLMLVAVVVPIVIVKNAVRIALLALLSAYIDPGVLNGPLHRSGGGLFFLLGLLLVAPILLLLLRAERRMKATSTPHGCQSTIPQNCT